MNAAPGPNMDSFQSHQKEYNNHHKTLGCKITHMFGVPMIVLSIPMLFFNWRWALALFAVGWVFQFIGHLVFEKNSPLFLADPRNPQTYCSALVFAATEWWNALTGKLAKQPSQTDEQNQ